MIPSTPMKRVSRPTRIALSAVSAMPRPRIAEPSPASWTAPVVNGSASASRAASSLWLRGVGERADVAAPARSPRRRPATTDSTAPEIVAMSAILLSCGLRAFVDR